MGKTTYESTRIDGITSQFGLEQLIQPILSEKGLSA